MYNFKLYNDFLDAAEECGLEVYSDTGAVIYLKLPEHIKQKFWCMLWTPLNKLELILAKDSWTRRLDTLKDNHNDFHLEFCPKDTDMGNYSFFPEINNKADKDITKDDMVVAIKKILDEDNWSQCATVAILMDPAE